MKYNPAWDQFIADVWFHQVLPDIDELIKDIVKQAKLNVVYKHNYCFWPWRTIVLVLAESHCVIHTYPEHAYINIDIYTCWSSNLEILNDFFAKRTDIKKIKIDNLKRWI